MTNSVKIEMPHPIAVIIDPEGGDVPDFVDDALVMATDSGLLVTCQGYVDGPTEFVLGNSTDVDPGTRPAFEGKLKTPSRRLAIETSEGDAILEVPTQGTNTVVRVWTNALEDPDKVIVGVD